MLDTGSDASEARSVKVDVSGKADIGCGGDVTGYGEHGDAAVF